MASQVLSGASNASYTNNTGQNVRLIINYMSNVTSMTWAGVTVTASSTTIGKDIPSVTITTSTGTITTPQTTGLLKGRIGPSTAGGNNILDPSGSFPSKGGAYITLDGQTSNINVTTTTTTSSSSNRFPIELMLASGQSFSAVCSAYNAIVIKEDGT
jgi:hypothetical protein